MLTAPLSDKLPAARTFGRADRPGGRIMPARHQSCTQEKRRLLVPARLHRCQNPTAIYARRPAEGIWIATAPRYIDAQTAGAIGAGRARLAATGALDTGETPIDVYDTSANSIDAATDDDAFSAILAAGAFAATTWAAARDVDILSAAAMAGVA